MNKAEFYQNLDELLELDPGTIKDGDVLTDLEAWDSMTVLSFIAMADEKYGVNIRANRIAECKSVNDLAAAICEFQAAPK